MKISKSVLLAALLAASLGVAAKKVAPVIAKGTHFISFDLEKMAFAPYDSDKSQQIFVMEPDGQIAPGVEVAQSSDGSKVLVLPPDIAAVFLGKDPEASAPKAAPQAAPKDVPPSQDKRYGQSLL